MDVFLCYLLLLNTKIVQQTGMPHNFFYHAHTYTHTGKNKQKYGKRKLRSAIVESALIFITFFESISLCAELHRRYNVVVD